MLNLSFRILLIWFFLVSIYARADEKVETFSNQMKRDDRDPKSTFWAPLATYLLPGLGQYRNGQEGAGVFYTGVGLVGLAVGGQASQELSLDDNLDRDFDSRDSRVQRSIWGFKTYDFSGSLSAYHYFQTVVNYRQSKGEYQFLPAERETTLDLMQAPFAFSNLSRWTTWLPLTLGLAVVVAEGAHDNFQTQSPRGQDLLFSSSVSYYAGVGEEALFRGWMFPMLVESFGVENYFWANFTQAAIFGLAHLSPDNPYPVFQTLAGYYFGWLAQKNNWSLQEAIFVHTWWDVITFTAAYTQGNRKASIYIPLYQTRF